MSEKVYQKEKYHNDPLKKDSSKCVRASFVGNDLKAFEIKIV